MGDKARGPGYKSCGAGVGSHPSGRNAVVRYKQAPGTLSPGAVPGKYVSAIRARHYNVPGYSQLNITCMLLPS